jgi:hypothetical protein
MWGNDLANKFAIGTQLQAQYPVGGGVLGPHIQHHLVIGQAVGVRAVGGGLAQQFRDTEFRAAESLGAGGWGGGRHLEK